MSVTLTNALFSARIATLGAEIRGLREHATGVEYIWQADPAHWQGSAPVLFPIIGGLKGGNVLYYNYIRCPTSISLPKS